MNEVKLVVFDLAGTTVRDQNAVPRTLKETLAQFDVQVSTQEMVMVMGIPKPVAIRSIYEEKVGAAPSALVHEIHQAFVTSMQHFYNSEQFEGEKEGVSETFVRLKQAGISVAVDTGFDRAITDPLLARLGWVKKGLIDCSVTSDEVMHGRPYPDMIFKAMEMTRVTSALSVAKVGDTASDMREGQSAGCPWVIGVTTGAFSRAQLEQEYHTHLIEQLPEVLPILGVQVGVGRP